MSEKTFVNYTSQRLGLDTIIKSGYGKLEGFIVVDPTELPQRSSRELNEYMVWLNHYSLFIRAEMGRARSCLNAAQRSLDINLYAAATEFKAGSLEERKALALEATPELLRTYEIISKQQIIVDQTEPIVWGIDNLIKSIVKLLKDRSADAH